MNGPEFKTSKPLSTRVYSKMPKSFTILCISHLEWTETLFQRPQQVMLRLSRKHKVIYFQEWSLKEWVQGTLKGKKFTNRWINSNLLVYNFVRPLPSFGGRWRAAMSFCKRLSIKRTKHRAWLQKLRANGQPMLFLEWMVLEKSPMGRSRLGRVAAKIVSAKSQNFRSMEKSRCWDGLYRSRMPSREWLRA